MVPSGRMADVSKQGLRRVLRAQGATEEEIRSMEAGLAAAVVAAQGKYVNGRVAVHLSDNEVHSSHTGAPLPNTWVPV